MTNTDPIEPQASDPLDSELREQLHDPIRKLSIQLTASMSVTGKVPEKLYEYEYELENSIVALIAQEREKVPPTVDRFEVIDDTGRAYVRGSIYGTPVSVKLDYQDNGKTLKVFVERTATSQKEEE